MIHIKNFIFNNYEIYPNKIYYIDEHDLYFFDGNEMFYICIKKSTDINENEIKVYFDLIEEVNSKNSKIKMNRIVKTKNNEFYCRKNNKIIILFKKESCDSIEEIVNFINEQDYVNTLNLPIVNLKEKIEKEIDKIEENVSDNYSDYPLVEKSFNYFIGMAENSVQLLNDYDTKNEKYLGLKSSFFDFEKLSNYNIFDFFRSNKYYNEAITIKKKIFLHEFNFNEIDHLIVEMIENDLIYLFSVFLYPIEYFDILSLMFSNEKELSRETKEKYNNVFKKIIDDSNYYLKFLNYFRNKCIKFKKIELINWII